VTLLLAVGFIGAIVKRLFRLAVFLAGVALLLIGAAVFVISAMR
jgi:hypothetical protein